MDILTDQYGIRYYPAVPVWAKRVTHYTEFQTMKPVLPAKKKDWDAVSLRFMANTEVESKDMPEQVLRLLYVTKKQWDGMDFTVGDPEPAAKKRLIYWEKQKAMYEHLEMEAKAKEAFNYICDYHEMFEWNEGQEYLTKSMFSGDVFLNILTKHSDYAILAENIQLGTIFIKDPDYVPKTDNTPDWL